MRCCQCQKELPDGVFFCKYCGAKQIQMPSEEVGEEKIQVVTTPYLQESMQPTDAKGAPPSIDPADKAKTTGADNAVPEPEAKLEDIKDKESEYQFFQPPKEIRLSEEPEKQSKTEHLQYAEEAIAEETPSDVKQSIATNTAADVGSGAHSELGKNPVSSSLKIGSLDVSDAELSTESPIRPEQNDNELFFDLDQILPNLNLTDTENMKPDLQTKTPSCSKGNKPLLFDLNQIPPPSAVENTKTVLSESEFATDAVQSDFPAEHNNNTQHIEKILEAEKQPLMQPEQEMQASMPCSVQNNISETNFKDFAKESSDVTTPELSISAEHNSGATIKPVLWRLVVIAAELSAIVFMSYKLFF